MSSGTPATPYASTGVVYGGPGAIAAKGGGDARDGVPSGSVELSPRQQILNVRWGYYRCTNYEARKFDWNGQPVLDPIHHDLVATQGYIPPGFTDAGASFPLKFRRPSAPYYMARVVVDRFTGLLFSERRHPKLTIEGDPDTEDYANALAAVGRLWAAFMQARTMGGGMGTAIVGFKLLNGLPVFEVHDARWCIPIFKDRFTQELAAIEKRFAYADSIRDPETGKWVSAWFWYRRVIDEQSDEVWERVPVLDGQEPDWSAYKSQRVEHNLGLCPAVWIQNLPNQEDVDGDPDCYGIYDLIEEHDRLMSQAARGTLANCDPTLLLTTELDMGEVQKGSDNAIKLEKGAGGEYLEISGAGIDRATTLADKVRDRAFDIAAYVPDDATTVAQTATEANARVARMFEKADVLREQYGERGIKRIVNIAIQACRSAGTPKVVEEPAEPSEVAAEGAPPTRKRSVVGVVSLPPRADGTPRKLGPGGVLTLKWPRYVEPTLDDILKASQAASTALTTGLIDQEVSANFMADYYPVDDAPLMLTRIKKQRSQVQDEFQQAALAAIKGSFHTAAKNEMNAKVATIPGAAPLKALPGGKK